MFTIDGQTTLSAWGELIWEEAKKEVYIKKLLPSPIKKIKYTDNFVNAVSSLTKDRIYLVNRRIDQLAEYFLKGTNPRSLDFKQLKGKPIKPSTHEIDAWSDKDAKRIFGHFENDVFVLGKIDQGLH